MILHLPSICIPRVTVYNPYKGKALIPRFRIYFEGSSFVDLVKLRAEEWIIGVDALHPERLGVAIFPVGFSMICIYSLKWG
jgi:hypothetical protein